MNRKEAIERGQYLVATQGGELADYVDEKYLNGSSSWVNGYPSGERRGGEIVCEYIYADKDGQPYLRVERTSAKQFLQSRWADGDWKYGKPKGAAIPYNLRALVAAAPDVAIYIAEGEKDADSLISLGLIATTAPGGAGKWSSDLNGWFVGKKRVYVVADNDRAGAKHAAKVAQNLANIVGEVRIVSLPGLDEGGDVSDWLKAGATREQLVALCAAAPIFQVLVLDPKDPMKSARALVDVAYTDASDLRIVHRHRAAFWHWCGSHYRLAADEDLRSTIWKFLEAALRRELRGKAWVNVPFKPTRAGVGDVLDALSAVTQLDPYIEPPAWLTHSDTVPVPTELMACGNGLLHLPTGTLNPPTPLFFNVNASEVTFDPEAPAPAKWLNFLGQIFGDDVEAIELLQDWFGYLLAPDTTQQKILLMVGPKRSGKGTIARVLKELLGRDSVAGPTMSSLSENFGLESLITKSLAVVSDARIGTRTDKSTIVERMLSISGEDQMTVARKFRDAWHGRLPMRIMILTNELPALSDGSGALAGRFLVLALTQNFYGREDQYLTEKLLTELPGILNWAIVGHRRLRERGAFIQPRSSQEAMDEIEMLAAPVKAFLRDSCIVGAGFKVESDALWGAWKEWCGWEGRRDPGTQAWFGRNLRSAVPGVTVHRLRGDGVKRHTAYTGVGLKAAAEREVPM